MSRNQHLAQPRSEWLEIALPVVDAKPYVALFMTDEFSALNDDGTGNPLIVRRADVAGLTGADMAQKLALRVPPITLTDMTMPPGTRLKVGTFQNGAGERIFVFRQTVIFTSIVREPDALMLALFNEPNEASPYHHETVAFAPNGMPYINLHILKEADENPRFLNHAALSTLALRDGFGVAIFDPGVSEVKPVASYPFGTILSLSIFKSLHPPEEYDPAAISETADGVPPQGGAIIQGRPSNEIMPPYARKAIAQRLAAAAGTPVEHEIYLLEYPEIDTLKRIKIVISNRIQLTSTQKKAVGDAVSWCLPYAVSVCEG